MTGIDTQRSCWTRPQCARILVAPASPRRRLTRGASPPRAKPALSLHPPDAAQGQYRPRPTTDDLKEIVEHSMEELFRTWDARFRDTYGFLHPSMRARFEKFTRCGDPHFGFLRVRCVNPDCAKKDEKIVPLSCKTRGLCPSCGQRRAIEWAERMVEEVLPVVPYRQLVFTIPIALRKAFLFDRSLYGDLCRVAYASTRDYIREHAPLLARQHDAVPAMIAAPQSFGDLLVTHAHVHAVVSLGLFRNDGLYFPMEDIDFSGLEGLFRERFFNMMLKKEKILPETVERFLSWSHSGFSVGFDRKLEADDRSGLEGLLSYMERPAVSLRRLDYRRDGRVHYQGSRVHPRLGTDHLLITPLEFLARLVPHVCLRYEVTIRCYGALSTTFRRKAGWIVHPPVDKPPPQPLYPTTPAPDPPEDLAAGALPTVSDFTGVTHAEETTLAPEHLPPIPTPPLNPPTTPASQPDTEVDSEFLRRKKRGWAKLIAKTWQDDPGTCKCCGQRMKIIAAIGPDQPDVIERILRHLHRWDPPWKRQRKVRGPPPSTAPPCPESAQDLRSTIDPIIDDELYATDPIWDDDEAQT